MASAFTACQIGRFAKRSCAPHQAYKLSKDNTHPSCTKLSNRIAAARAEKKKRKKQSSSSDALPLPPTWLPAFLSLTQASHQQATCQ